MPSYLALALAANERPFTRWRELTGTEQESFTKKAGRIAQHLRDYESVEPYKADDFAPAIHRPGMYTGDRGERTETAWRADACAAYFNMSPIARFAKESAR